MVDSQQTGAANIDESALVRALQAGEDHAFEQLVRTYGGRLLQVTRRFLRQEEDAQDAVQEAFLSAFRSIEKFKGDARLGTWLHRIAVNASLMKLRSRKRKPEQPIEPLLPSFQEDGHPANMASTWSASSEALLEREETRALVRTCIGKLPETYRNVLLLRDIEEMSTEETAQMIGITKQAVKTRLHRARLALRTLLDPKLRGDAA